MTYLLEPSYELGFRFRKILVPIDGSESSLKALDLSVDLAKRYGSKITVIHVRISGLSSTKDVLDKAKKRVENKGLPVFFKEVEIDYKDSSISKAILDEIIEGGYDLVVLGARGMTVSEELNIGSVATSITLNSPTTVIIVR